MEKQIINKIENFSKYLYCYKFENESQRFSKTYRGASTYKNIQCLIEITSFLNENNIKHNILEDETVQILGCHNQI